MMTLARASHLPLPMNISSSCSSVSPETDTEAMSEEPNTVCIKTYEGLNWSLSSPNKENTSSITNKQGGNCNSCIRYSDVINFSRCSKSHLCVMCGMKGNIPSQNKDVCKSCDTVFWFHTRLNVVIKFCKGCKNFVTLSEFQEKPEASKCGKCRHRGRQNYFARKNVSPRSSSPSHTGLEDHSDDASSVDLDTNSAHMSHHMLMPPEMMISTFHGVINRPPIAPRRSLSADQSPASNISFLDSSSIGYGEKANDPSPGLIPRVKFSRSTSDSSIHTNAADSPALRGICLDLKDTPRSGSTPGSFISSAMKRATPHSGKKSASKHNSKTVPDSSVKALNRKNSTSNRYSPRTVSFSLTPSPNVTDECSYNDHGSVLYIDCGEAWDTGLGAKEWDPSANPLMGLAMLTSALVSPPSKKQRRTESYTAASAPSSSSCNFSSASRHMREENIVTRCQRFQDLKVDIPGAVDMVHYDAAFDSALDSGVDICSEHVQARSNSKLPPRKRHLAPLMNELNNSFDQRNNSV